MGSTASRHQGRGRLSDALSRRVALVTGASSGIGAAFAAEYARAGYDLVLTARRGDRLDALASAIIAKTGARAMTLPLDLATPEAPDTLATLIAERGLAIDALVNNAGAGGPVFEDGTWQEHRAMVELMLLAPVALMHRVLPAMRARGFGRIVNVASFAGFLPGGPHSGLYRTVKAGLIRASETVWTPQGADGVHVTALCPGYVLSEFHDGTSFGARRPARPTSLWLSAGDVARAGYRAVEANRPIAVPGIAYRAAARLLAITPRALVRRATRHG